MLFGGGRVQILSAKDSLGNWDLISKHYATSQAEPKVRDDVMEGIPTPRYVQCMVVNENMDLYGWVASDGRAYVCQQIPHQNNPSDTSDSPHELPTDEAFTWAGICFHNTQSNDEHARTISINSKTLHIAVGGAFGGVYVYALSDDRSELRFSHQLIKRTSRQPSLNTVISPVTALEWTLDGMAIAASWKGKGIVVWSLFGNLLVDTQNDELSEYDNFRRPVLITNEKLLIYEGNYHEFDPLNLDLLQWESIQLPIVYISHNWPIQYVSIDKTGSYLAVAGRRGFAHYNCHTHRWKYFANSIDEQSFTVDCNMVWQRDILIVAVEDCESWETEIRFYSRKVNLDLKPLHSEPAPFGVIAMNTLDANLLVYTGDNVIRHYSVLSDNEFHVSVEMHQQILLDGVVANPSAVSEISWDCMNEIEPNLNEVKKTSILILKAGELSRLKELPEGGWEYMVLSDKIEFFWVPHYEPSLPNAIWALHHNGTRLWINLPTADGQRHDSSFVDLDLDYYPLCFLWRHGIILGASSEVVVNNSHSLSFKFSTKTQLFIHHIIRHLITHGYNHQALYFAKAFEALPHSNHALELLLHQVLEEEAESGIGFASGALLPPIVAFLKQFSNYLEIVARCARKTEVSVWEYMFSIIGDPKGLFYQCIELNMLKTAISYLIVIQVLDPIQVSGRCVIELLQKAFDSEDFVTGKEIVRFFGSVGGHDESFGNVIRSIATKLDIDLATNFDGVEADEAGSVVEKFHMELLIKQHARLLLKNFRLRSLARFANSFSLSLPGLFKKERNRAALIPNWNMALESIYKQFELPYPPLENLFRSQASEKRLELRRNSITAKATYNKELSKSNPLEGLPVPYPVLPRLAIPQKVASGPKSAPPRLDSDFSTNADDLNGGNLDSLRKNEILYLVECTRQGLCWAWCLLLLSMLQDQASIIEILFAHSDLLPLWTASMKESGSQVLCELAARVVDALSSEDGDGTSVKIEGQVVDT
ncbi:hypothetical protein HDV05_000150 [Chytridiales sp. JEL 0842]|nr:hypothetical protein HDV05_000150 [Chytridiales sp. JEL 0842]